MIFYLRIHVLLVLYAPLKLTKTYDHLSLTHRDLLVIYRLVKSSKYTLGLLKID